MSPRRPRKKVEAKIFAGGMAQLHEDLNGAPIPAKPLVETIVKYEAAVHADLQRQIAYRHQVEGALGDRSLPIGYSIAKAFPWSTPVPVKTCATVYADQFGRLWADYTDRFVMLRGIE